MLYIARGNCGTSQTMFQVYPDYYGEQQDCAFAGVLGYN